MAGRLRHVCGLGPSFLFDARAISGRPASSDGGGSLRSELLVEEVEYFVRGGRLELDDGIRGCRSVLGFRPAGQNGLQPPGDVISHVAVRGNAGKSRLELIKLGDRWRLVSRLL